MNLVLFQWMIFLSNFNSRRGATLSPSSHNAGVRSIVQAEGFGGIYRGVVPVMARQGANSAVRFGVYSTLSDLAKTRMSHGGQLPATYAFGIGAIAGIITVYTTMPLDVVKTKMQGLGAKELYRGAFDCAWKVFKGEGVLAFWKGATPRLARLSVRNNGVEVCAHTPSRKMV